MIQSILDNDLYKFTMQQAVHMLYPRAQAEYEFINRGNTAFPEGFAERVEKEIEKMAFFSLSKEQKAFLEKTCYFLTPVYLDYLEFYSFDPKEVRIKQEGTNFSLKVKGPWYRTILWEVPLMAIISETYFSMTGASPLAQNRIREVNRHKADVLARHHIRFADFGTRRRFSSDIHCQLVADILSLDNHSLIGTSNVHLAMEFNLTPIGTLAHEWFMFHAMLGGYKMANTLAQEAWVRVFNGNLGIALTDTFTTDVFLSSFDTLHGKLFDGVRQDSGDPVAFTEKIIRHYEGLHIDPTTKTIVFSDNLDMDKAIAIHRECRGRIRDSYGIGTNLTNDVGVTPLNIVIKMSRCRKTPERPWHNTVKLSDDRGKHTGDKKELETCMAVLEIDKKD